MLYSTTIPPPYQCSGVFDLVYCINKAVKSVHHQSVWLTLKWSGYVDGGSCWFSQALSSYCLVPFREFIKISIHLFSSRSFSNKYWSRAAGVTRMERYGSSQFSVHNLSFSSLVFSHHIVSCRYKIIKEVGNGTFGTVWRAISKQSGEVVCATLFL